VHICGRAQRPQFGRSGYRSAVGPGWSRAQIVRFGTAAVGRCDEQVADQAGIGRFGVSGVPVLGGCRCWSASLALVSNLASIARLRSRPAGDESGSLLLACRRSLAAGGRRRYGLLGWLDDGMRCAGR
jgi:hypothetical protein